MSQKALTPMLFLALYTMSILLPYMLSASPLSVRIDKKVYDIGDTVIIMVKGPAFNDVAVELRNPKNVIVYVDQARLTHEGCAEFRVTIPGWWLEGEYTLYVAVPGFGKAIAKFKVIRKGISQIIIHASSIRVSINRPLTLYIFLNPPLSEKVLLEIYKERRLVASPVEILLNRGFASYTLKLNDVGIYIIKISWPGNIDYKGSTSQLSISVVEEDIAIEKLNCTLEIIPQETKVGEDIEIRIQGIQPNENLYLLFIAPNGTQIHVPLRSKVFRFKPDTLGAWSVGILLYGKNLVQSSSPTVFYVKAESKIALTAENYEIGVGRTTRLIAKVYPSGRRGLVNFFILLNGSWVYLGSSKIINSEASLKWKAREEGVYFFKAVWEGDTLYLGSESNIIKIESRYRLIPVILETIDHKGRLLRNSIIIVNGSKYMAEKGIYELYLRKTFYKVIIIWKDTVVFNSTIVIQKPGIIKLKCEVYDIRIYVRDLLQNPIKGEVVSLIGQKFMLAGITSGDGSVIFRQIPRGHYILKVREEEIKIEVDSEKTFVVLRQPPWHLIILAVIIAAMIIFILYRFIEIEVIIEEEEKKN